MGIVVGELLNLVGRALHLHLQADHDIEVLGFLRGLLVPFAAFVEARVVGVLHVVASMVAVGGLIDAAIDEVGVEVLDGVVFAQEIDHRARLALLVDEVEARDASVAADLGVVGTKGGGGVDDARTVFGSDVVARDDDKGGGGHLYKTILAVLAREDFVGMGGGVGLHLLRSVVVELLRRLHPGHELVVADAYEVSALHAVDDAVGHDFVATFVGGHVGAHGHFALGLQISSKARLGHDGCDLLGRIGVVGLHGDIVDAWAHTEGYVGGQRPGRGGPGQEDGLAPFRPALLRVADGELGRHRGVLDIAVAAGKVQLMARKARAGGGGVGLDGVALVETVLVVELLQEPPQGLDKLVVVGHIRVLQIDEIAHLLGQLAPFGRELQYVGAAMAVVIYGGNILV